MNRHFQSYNSPLNIFKCANCGETMFMNKSQLFTWSKCNHQYCKPCASNVVNQCLSALNCIPVCPYPKCGRLLDISDGNQIQSLLLKKYRIDSNVKRFVNIEYALAGYIRCQQRKLKNNIIPYEVSVIISNYYATNLMYTTKTKCNNCTAFGYKFKQCHTCSGNGQYPIHCTKCHPSHPGIYKYSVNCYQCKGSGNKLVFEKQCNQCDGDGEIVKECRRCNGSGIYRNERQCHKCNGAGVWRKSGNCKRCNGTGKYTNRKTCDRCKGHTPFRGRYGEIINHCNKCNNSGIFQKTYDCRNCNGSGQWSTRGTCYGCNGKGTLPKQICNQCDGDGVTVTNCRKCSGTGIFRKFKKCQACNGHKIFHKEKRCGKCNATGYVSEWCATCGGCGEIRYDCPACKTLKYFIMLDFNKLCNKQLLCIKCNEYYPVNMVTYWSSCCHVICVSCVDTFIPSKISANIIPICPVKACKKEISMKSMKLFNKYYIRNGNYIEKQLEVLFDRKDKFNCVNCDDWHDNRYIFQCANNNGHQFGRQCAVYWTHCNHSFCMQCILPYVATKINSSVIPICMMQNCVEELSSEIMGQFIARGINKWFHSNDICHLKRKLEILIDRKGKSQCCICYKWELDSCLFYWSNCYHAYHKKCVREYINKNLQTEESIFNILKKESIPICFTESCNQSLTVIDAKRFGVTDYQYKTLGKLINKQNKSDDCIVM